MDIRENINFILNKNGLIPKLIRESKPLDIDKAREVFRIIGTEIIGKEYLITSNNRFTIDNVIRWLHVDEDMKAINPSNKNEIISGDLKKGLYIGGTTGTGKTIITEIINIYCEYMELRYNFGYEIGIIRFTNIRSDAIIDDYMNTGSIQKYKNTKFLMIQDFGAENTEALFMGTRMNVLKSIIEARGDKRDVCTIITSNYPMTENKVMKYYGERIISRLQEMCNYFVLLGEDFRTLQ